MSRRSSILPSGTNQLRGALVLGGASIVVLAIAWGFELVGGYVPCKLCLEQREGYYVTILLAGLAALGALRDWPAVFVRGALGLCMFALLLSATTGAYQAGAEWGMWAGPSDCGGGSVGGGSGEDLMAMMQATRIVPCDEASWRFLFLSFAGWNVVIALFLAKLAGIAALMPAGGFWWRDG